MNQPVTSDIIYTGWLITAALMIALAVWAIDTGWQHTKRKKGPWDR